MVKCLKCAAEQAQASKFCSECGAALRPPHTTTVTHAVGFTPEGGSSYASDSSLHGRFLPGTTIARRYRIVSLVGKGGMGEVYRADDLKLGHTVALKFLPQEVANDTGRLDYFHSEVRLTRQISHANVCRVHDIGEVDGQHFLSMEYIDGEDLGALLRRIGRLPQDKGVQIAQQLCAGLAAAHEQGVLHRDLKPANIMIDGRGQVRITDFGLARLAEEVVEGECAGTPAYMSPEQLARGASTIQSDLYALGLVLYEVFTGEAAHKAETLGELQRLRQDSAVAPPSSQVDDMDPVVERVILHCLEREPHERPQSAAAVAAALPGGDPLAVAVAAGETPSPELVANAGETGTLSRKAAIVMLAGAGLCLLLNAWLADRTSILRESSRPRKPIHPMKLEKIAQDAVRQLGYKEDHADHCHGFMTDGRSALFWYRQRQKTPIVMDSFWAPVGDPSLTSRARPTYSRPPMELPDEVGVQLTPDGLLRSFRARPSEAVETDEPLWDIWFSSELIGYHLLGEGLEASDNPGDFPQAIRISPEECPLPTPPDPFDAIALWRVDSGQRAIYIQAAAFKGRPVYLDIKPPTSSGSKASASSEEEIIEGHRGRVWREKDLLVLIGTAALAFWNLRTGRTDKRGAIRLTQFLFWIGVVAWLLQTRHLVMAGYEIAVVTLGLAQVAYVAAMICLTYVGFEPLIRRFWPELLITTMRIVHGRYRDPRVGRDLLAGVLAGSVVVLLHRVNMMVHEQFFDGRFNHSIYFNSFSLLGTRQLTGCILDAVSWSITVGWEVVVLVVLVRLFVRSEFVAVLAGIVFSTYVISILTGSDFRIAWLSLGALMVLQYLVIVRLGLLTWVTVLTVYFLACTLPVVTIDPNVWNFGHGMLVNAAIIAIAIYGFVISQGWWRPGGSLARPQ